MLKQWLCAKRLLWIGSVPGVLTVTDDMLSFFPTERGSFASPVEMRLQDIVQVTSATGWLIYGRVSIQSWAQSMTLYIHGESAEIVAKFIQAAVDRVKSQLAEPVRSSPSVAQGEPSS